MSLRAIAWAWAWCAAVLLAAGLVLADRAAKAPPTFGGAAIAVIGSSQTQYGFAKHGGGAASLLGDGRSHVRIGLPAISEPEALALVERAVSERTGLVLVEVWPLVADVQRLANRGRCDQPARGLRTWLKLRQRALTDAVARWAGRAVSTDGGGEPPDLDRQDPQDFTASTRGYALVLRGLCDAQLLAQAVRRAQAGGTQVVLMAPPRSATAQRLLGEQQSAALDQAARTLAANMGVPLFAPRGPWPDDRFVSIGHVSRAGRAQMRDELRRWISRQP